MGQHGRRDMGWGHQLPPAGLGPHPLLTRGRERDGEELLWEQELFTPPLPQPSICIYMPQSSPASVTIVLFCSEAVAFL